MEELEQAQSFIDRKRPAVEGLIEDIIGPTALLDKVISGNPPLTAEQVEVFDPEGENDHS